MSQERIFHNLSAGSTTIMSTGKVIRFGGKIQQIEGGTRVGRGEYRTSDPTEIKWLESLCKQPSPQVWEEIPETPNEPPAAVMAGIPADTKKAASDVQAQAAQAAAMAGINTPQQAVAAASAASKSPAVAALQAKLGKIDNDPAT